MIVSPTHKAASQAVVPTHPETNVKLGSVALGTGLAFASMIVVPALSQAVGLGPSLTSAIRVMLMKASSTV